MYATAARGKDKVITLTVSTTGAPRMITSKRSLVGSTDSFSIASALCGLLLKTPKADDALLLYS